MIKEAKDVLEQVITEHSEMGDVIRDYAGAKEVSRGKAAELFLPRSAIAEKKATSLNRLPIVSLISETGDFDDRQAAPLKYFDEPDQMYKERKIRGERRLPLMIRCWHKDEEAADELISSFLPYIPRFWESDGLEGRILIDTEERSDRVNHTRSVYLSVVRVEFYLPVATKPVAVPAFSEVESGPEREEDEADYLPF